MYSGVRPLIGGHFGVARGEFLGLSFIGTSLALLLAQGLEEIHALSAAARKHPTPRHDGSDDSATSG
jgi:hypothetical protein